MGDLSKNFSKREFACKCGCGFDATSSELIAVLELVRGVFNNPVTVLSGCRCEKHNKAVGGEEQSKHTKGIAADIQVKDTKPEVVAKYLDEVFPDTYGIGLYKTWVHIDIRKGRSRWQK